MLSASCEDLSKSGRLADLFHFLQLAFCIYYSVHTPAKIPALPSAIIITYRCVSGEGRKTIFKCISLI